MELIKIEIYREGNLLGAENGCGVVMLCVKWWNDDKKWNCEWGQKFHNTQFKIVPSFVTRKCDHKQ